MLRLWIKFTRLILEHTGILWKSTKTWTFPQNWTKPNEKLQNGIYIWASLLISWNAKKVFWMGLYFKVDVLFKARSKNPIYNRLHIVKYTFLIWQNAIFGLILFLYLIRRSFKKFGTRGSRQQIRSLRTKGVWFSILLNPPLKCLHHIEFS